MSERTYPVVEVFGPTFQGEGPAVGRRCYFVRLGGCDYRCEWCDTMYAVEPAQVREAPRLTADDIVEALLGLGLAPEDLLILSGGNPALHHLAPVLDALPAKTEVHIETQGTMFRDWINRLQMVVVSPKPPSAGMGAAVRPAALFTSKLTVPWCLKLVAFDEADLDWCVEAEEKLADPDSQFYLGAWLSAGTPQHFDRLIMQRGVLESFGWLARQQVARPDLTPFRIGLQAHVLVWPGEKAR